MDLDQCNILAIEVIEFLGNNKPAQDQIDLVEYLVSNAMSKMNANKEPEYTP